MKEVTGSAEPEDAQKWISAAEAAALLRLGRDHFVAMAKKRGYTRWQARRNTMSFFLRKEIDSWADFRGLRRKWLAKYPGPGGEKRYKEKIDLETARRLFIPSEEAAALLGVSRITVYGMARIGRLVCYQTAPGHNGSRLWFSRRAVMQLVEDPERLKKREIYLKRSQKGAGGNPDKISRANNNHKNIPENGLTAKQAAERLGVCVSRIQTLRLTGRLRGEPIWRRNKPTKRWYYPDYEVERLISQREQVKALAELPDIPVPASADEAPPAPAVPEPARPERRQEAPPAARVNDSMWVEGDARQPKWACDDVNLTRAFYLQGRSEY